MSKKPYSSVICFATYAVILLGSTSLFAMNTETTSPEKTIENGWVYVERPEVSAQASGGDSDSHSGVSTLVKKHMTDNVGGVLGSAYTGSHDQQGYKNAIASIKANFHEDVAAQRAALKQLKEHYEVSKDAINDRGEGHRLRTSASFHHDEINKHLKEFEGHIQQQESQKKREEEKHPGLTVGSDKSNPDISSVVTIQQSTAHKIGQKPEEEKHSLNTVELARAPQASNAVHHGEKKNAPAQAQAGKAAFRVTKASGTFGPAKPLPVRKNPSPQTPSGKKVVTQSPHTPSGHQ